MFCYRKVLQWFFSVFLICSPVPYLGRSIDGSSRTRRSVTHAQLMHDKGRALQDFRRRLWLQELLDEVHTAEVREVPGRGPGLHPSTTGSTGHSKPPGGTKNLPASFLLEEQPAPNPPQETLKAPSHKETLKAPSHKEGPPRAPGRRRKKGRGRRREGDKRKRRVRSLGPRPEDQVHLGPRPEDQIHLGPRPEDQTHLGPRPEDQVDQGRRPEDQIHLGRRPEDQIHLGRRPEDQVDQGRRPEDQIHLGRRPEDQIHLGRRPEDQIHLGRRPEDQIHLKWSSLLGLQRALL